MATAEKRSLQHTPERKVERKDYYRAERSASALTRSLRLPVEVQAEKMTAELKDGVLVIRAPKAGSAEAGGGAFGIETRAPDHAADGPHVQALRE